MSALVLVWFRRDLRTLDHPALNAAIAQGRKVLPVFIYDPEFLQPWAPGAASRWYLHHSLASLREGLEQLEMPLRLYRGDSQKHLIALIKSSKVTHVYWNRIYEPAYLRQDEVLQGVLKSMGVKVKILHDHSLIPPDRIKNLSGKLYKVFTPFWRNLSSLLTKGRPQYSTGGQALSQLQGPLPDHVITVERQDGIPGVDQLNLLDTHPWQSKLYRYWRFGEKSALKQLDDFKENMVDYPVNKDFPAEQAGSGLSAALHFGEISPWRIVETLRPEYLGECGKRVAQAAESLLRQLGWREFAIYLLYHFPHSANRSLRGGFEDSGIWYHESRYCEMWRSGRTGYPLVDAGMRQLWETGWMHNRIRMVVASFLTKNLGQHWIHGARWFWDTLIDADLANNTMGWQWVAGCGCDAAPYYRIFNPLTQAERFDPSGTYRKRWSGNSQVRAPIVDLSESRNAALERYGLLRANLKSVP